MKVFSGFAIAVLVCLAAPSWAASPFGLHGVYGDAAAVRDLGVRQVRVAALTWGSIERQKGRYDFSRIDKGISKLQGRGIDSIVATIRDINKWGGNSRAQRGYKRGHPLTSSSGFPSDIEAWKKFIHTVVERYDGDGIDDMPGLKYPVRYWQVEGEWMWQWKDTTENYLRFLGITYREIKSADPSASVICGAITGGIAFAVGEGFDSRGYFEKGGGKRGPRRVPRARLLKNRKYKKAIRKVRTLLKDGKDSFDIVDVHIYSRDAYSIPSTVAWLKAAMERYGYSKPVWSLENAGPFYGYSEEAQAGEVVKRYILGVSAGLEKIFWSSLHVTQGWSENYKRLSLIDDNDRKKTAYFTYKLLSSRLDGFDSIKRLDMGEGIYAFKVEKGGAAIYVLWSERGGRVRLPVASARVRITETVSLKKEERAVHGNEIKIDSGSAPIIIEEL